MLAESPLPQDDEGDHIFQGQDDRHHQRGPQVTEEQHQQADHEDGGFGQRTDNVSDSSPDQVAAIIEHGDRKVFGSDGLSSCKLFFGLRTTLGVGAAQAEHERLDCSRGVGCHGAVAGDRANAHAGDSATRVGVPSRPSTTMFGCHRRS